MMLSYVHALGEYQPRAVLSIWVEMQEAMPLAMLFSSRQGLQWRTSMMAAPEAMPDADQAIRAFLGFLDEVVAYRAPIPHMMDGPFVVERSSALAAMKLAPESVELLDQLRATMGDDWAFD